LVQYIPAPSMRLAIFDLDHTLLAGDSDHLWKCA
jgi:phosphoserine phosphatase